MKKLLPHQKISQDLKSWPLRVWSANIAALLLGVVSAITGLVIGPSMKLLFDPKLEQLSWEELIGPAWSRFFETWISSGGIRADVLLSYLPHTLFIITTLRSALTFFQWYTWEWLGEHLAFKWRQDLAHSFLYVDPKSREDGSLAAVETSMGGLISQDIRTCRDYVVHFFGGLPREGLQTLFMGVSLILLSPKLFAIFSLSLAPIGILLARLGRKLRKRASKALENNSELGEWIQQRLLGIETIKHYETEVQEKNAMLLASNRLFIQMKKAAALKSMTSPMIEFIGVAGICAALGIAFYEISTGRISGTVAMSFFSSLALFAQSAAKLGRYFNSNREGLAAAERIFGGIDRFHESQKTNLRALNISETVRQPKIILSDVSFNYGSISAVSQCSYQFGGGKVYCVVGESGAGKTTLLNLILGLCFPSSGEISIQVPKNFKQTTLPVTYIPQAAFVVPAMLGENVSYPLLSFDEQRIEQSLSAVGFYLDSSRLPEKSKTRLGAGQLRLSGGQNQRIQLARLVYHGSPVVLVDEGTSALDPELEKIVLQRIRLLAEQGSLVIMIAHRRAAAEAADEVLVMNHGKIAVSGPWKDVMHHAEFKKVFQAST